MEEETKKTEQEETEAEISRAMRARVKDFKEQADSLTLEGVRRALEKDLGMETFSLDVHKRFIKQCLEEFFYGGGDDNLSTTSGIASDKPSSPLIKEASGGKDQPQEPKDFKSSTDNEVEEESPAEELMSNHKHVKTEEFENDNKLIEDIKKAIKKQGPYFRENLEKITFGKVRRLLEQDLNLEKNTLDAYKSFISDVLDEVLQSTEFSEATNGIKKKSKKASQLKVTGKVKKETMTGTEDSESSNLDNDMSEADEDTVVVKSSKKRPPQKGKLRRPIKHQKTSSDENRPSGSRKKKREVLDTERGSESEVGKSSDDSRAPSSSDEKSKKKHEKPTGQAYGKQVERLKSIIKSCGMGVSPAIYKRAKQAPESKREAFLIKELEDILAKEGLSSNPTDKEIKAVKKKKDRARELEGIDMSNIVSSSRRRSTFSFIPPPKPKVEAESDEDEEAEVEEDEVEEDEVEEDDDEQEDTDDGDNGSGEPSEGSEEDADEDSN